MGASLALASCPGRAGEYAALTGARLDAADVVALGLATHCVASSSIDEICDALAALDGGQPAIWRGPGIDGEVRVAIDGLGDGFWPAWSANHALFPCGVDLVFASGSRLIALPRSVAVEA